MVNVQAIWVGKDVIMNSTVSVIPTLVEMIDYAKKQTGVFGHFIQHCSSSASTLTSHCCIHGLIV